MATWHVPEMAHAEISSILKSKFPTLPPLLPAMLGVYYFMVNLFAQHSHARSLSICDLIKWCHRVARLGLRDFNGFLSLEDTHVCEILFREAHDCFNSMIPQRDVMEKLALALGAELGLTQDRVEYFLYHHVPIVAGDKTAVQFGRVTLEKSNELIGDTSTFATTARSTRLLEKIAVYTALLEPILLVGETGTGKTTVLQRLAAQLKHRLVVINMSQKSDSADLLG